MLGGLVFDLYVSACIASVVTFLRFVGDELTVWRVDCIPAAQSPV